MMDLKALNQRLFTIIRQDYRNLHQMPEIHDDLPRTRQYLLDQLTQFDVNLREDVGNHGIVATLDGEGEGKCVAWRADMDALPMAEKTELAFRSAVPNRMHACGHDAHMAIGLGILRLLAQNRHRFKGQVKFIFQPAEETTGGARPMMEDGALDHPKVDYILGLHVWPSLELGQIGLARRELMAGGVTLKIHIQGKGGHAGRPHEAINPIVVAAKLINEFEAIKNYDVPSQENIVLSFGLLQSGSVFNVIPDTAELHGTVRYFNHDLKQHVLNRLDQICQAIARLYGADITLKVIENYPPTINHPEIVERLANTIARMDDFSPAEITVPSMGSEDFSFFLQAVPGAFIWLGMKPPGQADYYEIHHPKFAVNEDIFLNTPALAAQMILDLLE